VKRQTRCALGSEGYKLAWLCLGTSFISSSTQQNSSVIDATVDMGSSLCCGLINNSFGEAYVFVKLPALVYDLRRKE